MAFHNFDYLFHMRDTKCIRNVCILAHVDHGKTTFSDSLIASNGIISSRDVGRVHYLDFREDEQLKQITMKSSSITLIYSTTMIHGINECFLINLIDSPGHIDFSTEVQTAVDLSDGSFLVIDVIEGVCAQTRSAMKQISLEHICPCLVLNKIDKLILKMKFNPVEAYYHLFQLLEQINAVMAGFITFHEFESKTKVCPNSGENSDGISEYSFFSPLKGNVIFASSLDGWGFTITNFVDLFSQKLGYCKKLLASTLWGDYFISNKLQSILPNAQTKGKRPLFASLILDSIWSIYQFAYLEKNLFKVNNIVKKLGISIHLKDIKHPNKKHLVQSILQQWLPLSEVALNMAVCFMPGPQNLSEKRIECLLTNYTYQKFASLPSEVKSLKTHFSSCNSDSFAPQVAYVSKMMAFTLGTNSILNKSGSQPISDILLHKVEKSNYLNLNPINVKNISPLSYCIVAFTRVFTGTLYKGQSLYFLHPRYDPKNVILLDYDYLKFPDVKLSQTLPPHVSLFRILQLYILMGGELIEVDSVPAGNICGVSGFDNNLMRNGTLSNTLSCIPFSPLSFDIAPILRVALEPVRISELDGLIKGIKLLAQADPCVQVGIEDSGENVIYCAGEVHLKKCIYDLTKLFAVGINFDVSAPIIPFRETILHQIDAYSDKDRVIKQSTSDDSQFRTINYISNLFVSSTQNKKFEIALRVCHLPSDIVEYLEFNSKNLRLLNCLNSQRDNLPLTLTDDIDQDLRNFKVGLNKIFNKAGKEWRDAADRIRSFGPKMVGPNILMDNVHHCSSNSIWTNLITSKKESFGHVYDNSIMQGFQLATLQGPLCHEPLHGVCFIIEECKFLEEIKLNSCAQWDSMESTESTNSRIEPFGPFSGQIISTVVKTCRQALLSQPIRLMLAMFSCSIQCTQEVLGSVMAVINRRGGKCIDHNVQVGTNLFLLETCIPVVESLGFSDEIRKKTSGLALPQLIFSHWEVLLDDPFWTPTTAEELLYYGQKADSENISKKYVDNIRNRKGLCVKSKIVESAEKQRTIKK